MTPENLWLEDVLPFWVIPFLGDMLVFRVSLESFLQSMLRVSLESYPALLQPTHHCWDAGLDGQFITTFPAGKGHLKWWFSTGKPPKSIKIPSIQANCPESWLWGLLTCFSTWSGQSFDNTKAASTVWTNAVRGNLPFFLLEKKVRGIMI